MVGQGFDLQVRSAWSLSEGHGPQLPLSENLCQAGTSRLKALSGEAACGVSTGSGVVRTCLPQGQVAFRGNHLRKHGYHGQKPKPKRAETNCRSAVADLKLRV